QYFSVDKNKGQTLDSITLEEAILIIRDDKIFKNGKSLGFSSLGEILLKKGRYGSYLEYDKKTKTIKEDEIDTMTLEKAVSLFNNDETKGTKRNIENLGEVLTGRYGTYLKLTNGTNINLKQLKITEEALMLMSDNDIKNLIDGLGPQITKKSGIRATIATKTNKTSKTNTASAISNN
ncbi:MAG: topoisomerase C-terminal repeat-containing protein, partial [Candidatus Paceibacterota bacterium]